MSETVRGLVVAHGTLAGGLVDSVRQIAGAGEDVLLAMSNEGAGPDELRARVEAALGAGPAVVFTDLGSGSCAFCARKVAIERPETAVVTGVNLPVLLDFVFHRELPLAELVERLVEKGKAGISGTTTAAAHADRALSR
jgi:PTS system mannose-specific IIB component